MPNSLPAAAAEAFRAYQNNLRWAKTHDDELEPYTDKFVAVADGHIVASAASREEIQTGIKDTPGVYVTFVVKRGLSWLL